MAGHRNFKELRKQLDQQPGADERREQARQDVERELDAHAQGLTQLRRARALTQNQVAGHLGISQAQISRVENQSDMYLSTLSSYLEAMGARLELICVLDDDRRVPLALGDVVEAAKPQRRRTSRSATRRKTTRPSESVRKASARSKARSASAARSAARRKEAARGSRAARA